MAVPELPVLSGAELRAWLVGDGPTVFVDSVRAWSSQRAHPQPVFPFLPPATVLTVQGVVESLWPWCARYRARVVADRAAGVDVGEESPVSGLLDALLAADRARAGKLSAGGRARARAAAQRVTDATDAAVAYYEQVRVRVGQQLAGVAAATEPVKKPGPPPPVRVPVTIN